MYSYTALPSRVVQRCTALYNPAGYSSVYSERAFGSNSSRRGERRRRWRPPSFRPVPGRCFACRGGRSTGAVQQHSPAGECCGSQKHAFHSVFMTLSETYADK